MRAAVNIKYGPPEVIKLMEVEKPVPKDDEVLVKVYATTVNRTDCGIRSANYLIIRFFYGLIRPKYKILGNEFAGVIETIGKSVTSFKIGDKVFGYNDKKLGAHADYLTISEFESIALMPVNLSFQEAAPITEGAHYALRNIRSAGVKDGQDVLVFGASGAIGSAAVQLVKYFGAKVTAVCNTINIDRVKSLGPDLVIDYTSQDITKIDQTFDFIFDAVGKISFRQCKQLLKNNGIYISTDLGKNGENIFLPLLTLLMGGKKVLFPAPKINKDIVLFLKDLVEKGKYTPLIDRQYPLEQIIDAYKYVETGQKSGNIVITLT